MTIGNNTNWAHALTRKAWCYVQYVKTDGSIFAQNWWKKTFHNFRRTIFIQQNQAARGFKSKKVSLN